jgi:hypothetical protein
MDMLKLGNLALRFGLELCLLAALGWWGFSIGGALIVKILLALVIVVAVAGLWGVLLSPRRPVKLPDAVRLVIELVLFGLAAAALATTGHPALGAALAVAYLINKGLIVLWKQG